MPVFSEVLEFELKASECVVDLGVFLLFKPQLFNQSVLLLSEVRNILSIVACTLVSDLSLLIASLLLVLE